MKILVLGGTGAIGADLVKILSEREHNLYVTSRKKKTKKKNNIEYIQGDARDDTFLEMQLVKKYDVIIDFMYYSVEEFKRRIDHILDSTTRYVFLSSARVYADSKLPISEESPRLLDVCLDYQYLKTDEYALTKAREENILYNHPNKNWTIIRPYITYNSNRLQLGIFEKEEWLYRALSQKKIIFPKELMNKATTLTHGYDVAYMITQIIEDKESLGEVYQITQPESIEWKEVLEIYLDTLEKKIGFRPQVIEEVNLDKLGILIGREAQLKYDRLYNRIFESSKMNKGKELEKYISVKEGIKKSLEEFLESKEKQLIISPRSEAIIDRFTRERKSYGKIKGWKNKIQYFIYRNSPVFLIKVMNFYLKESRKICFVKKKK